MRWLQTAGGAGAVAAACCLGAADGTGAATQQHEQVEDRDGKGLFRSCWCSGYCNPAATAAGAGAAHAAHVQQLEQVLLQ